jgi:PAS domain S-box-containing protein
MQHCDFHHTFTLMAEKTTLFGVPLISGDALKEIFQSMMEGFVVIDKKGTILLVNPIAERMFGYEENELPGKNLETLLPERYRKHHVQLRNSFNDLPTPRRMGLGRDLTGLRKNGIEFPIEISLSYSTAGGVFVAIAFISDISLRKVAEEALRQSEEQLIVYASELEKKVKSRTEDLNASVQKLEKEVAERKRIEEDVLKALAKERELNEMKSKFVSIASHEFRTPLSTILSSVALIDQYHHAGQADKVAKHISRVRASIKHMTSILDDLLSVGRLEEGKVEVIRESVNVQELLSDIAEEVGMTLKPDQQLLLDCQPDVPLVVTDSRMLRNILFNLLSNASKYSEAGSPIRLACAAAKCLLSVSITDEGIGIPEEDQQHLFDRFFRASNVLNIQGTGLGLNIVKRYLDLLNGSITYASKPGHGSTFTIYIPLQSQ